MRTFADVKDRLVFIDFPTGAHGHFLSKVLNGLGSTVKRVNTVDKNYHTATDLALVWDCQALQSQPLSDIPLNCIVPWYLTDLFWPIHYGGCGRGTRKYADYRVIEIYVKPDSYYRYYINRWMNVPPYPRADLRNNDWFVQNFYNVANGMSGPNGSKEIKWFAQTHNIDNPADYAYSIDDVLEILEYNISTAEGHRTRGVRYDVAQTAGQCASVEMMELYSFDTLVDAVRRIKNTFGLTFDIDEQYIQQEWNHFISIQLPSSIDTLPAKNNPHVIEQAYLNFLNKQ